MRAPHAAAFAAVVALALAGCGGDGDSGAVVTATSVTEPATTSSVAPTSGPTSDESADPAADMAVEVVRGWLTALRDGDLEAADASMGSWSRAAADEMGGLDALASGLAEGMAAFAAEDVEWDALALPGSDGAYVVVASGEVEREGMTETDSRAWIVRSENGQDVVEAFTTPPPEVVVPLPGETLPTDAAVEVLVPAGGVHVAVDGELATSGVTTEGADGDQVKVEVAPDGGWSGGRHVVAVASVPESNDAPGPWTAVAVTFETS